VKQLQIADWRAFSAIDTRAFSLFFSQKSFTLAFGCDFYALSVLDCFC
jgi:hypothetical protein